MAPADKGRTLVTAFRAAPVTTNFVARRIAAEFFDQRRQLRRLPVAAIIIVAVHPEPILVRELGQRRDRRRGFVPAALTRLRIIMRVVAMAAHRVSRQYFQPRWFRSPSYQLGPTPESRAGATFDP
jgi:hypothetical protein